MIHPAVEEVMIGIVKSRDHTGADNFDGLNEVRTDDVVAGEPKAGDGETLKKLSKQAFAAFGFNSRAVGGGFCREGLRVGHLHVRVHFAEER